MSTQTKLLVVGLPILAALAFFARGCGRYDEVNEVTYEHAKALYSACNRHDQERVEACADMITKAMQDNEMSSPEAAYLTGIIASARKDQWQDAQAMARQLMVDQVVQ